MTNSNTYQNFFPNKKENNEEKIKELEKKLKELEDEEIERKNYMEESKTTYAKNIKTIEPLMCKITKIKRTKYNAQK